MGANYKCDFRAHRQRLLADDINHKQKFCWDMKQKTIPDMSKIFSWLPWRCPRVRSQERIVLGLS